MRTLVKLFFSLCLIAASGTAHAAKLHVNLNTNYVPGTDFNQVQTSVKKFPSGPQIASATHSASSSNDYKTYPGTRVASLNVPKEKLEIRVTLKKAGSEVAHKTIQVNMTQEFNRIVAVVKAPRKQKIKPIYRKDWQKRPNLPVEPQLQK